MPTRTVQAPTETKIQRVLKRRRKEKAEEVQVSESPPPIKKKRTPKKVAPTTKTKETNLRKIIYERPVAIVFSSATGKPMSVKEAKDLLGWTEPSGDQDKLDPYLLLDQDKRTIFCSNIDLQRPYYKTQASTLMFDILSGNWEFNLESVIIGETGLVLDGKHRLIALVLAVQEYNKNPDRYPFWTEEPQIEILIAAGAKENAKLVNTIGTGKPRSISDSFYASGIFDADQLTKDGRVLCRMAQYAFNYLWKRTGEKEHAFTSKPTHADALDFIDRHPYLLQCIKSIHEMDADRQISNLVSAGYAAALMYLMSTSTTSEEDVLLYQKMDHPDETMLNLDNAPKAEKFWSLLSKREDAIKPIVTTITKLVKEGNTNASERCAIIIKAWNLNNAKKKITSGGISLKSTVDDKGERWITEDPTVKGIDIGELK